MGKRTSSDQLDAVDDETVLGGPSLDDTDSAQPAVASAKLSLLVLGEQQVATHPLPPTGTIAIGRSPKADVMIDDTSISRQHATLLLGASLSLRDEGSANGTWVNGKRLATNERVPIEAGTPVQIGNITIIVQRRATPLVPRRLWTHDYFEVRLGEECSRVRRGNGTFALLRIRSPSLSSEALQSVLRLSDVVGEYGPGDYEVLLVDATPDAAQNVVSRFADQLTKRDLNVEIGLACFPRDGSNPDELIAYAARFGRPVAATEVAVGESVIIGDRSMVELYRLATRVAGGSISVLILGETGAGKEVLAAHVHRSSPRAAKPYLKLNCAALSETLLESELFGHERGAFTGAVKDKPGLLETADGGTVFLDELGEIPLSIQVKLLRVLEEREVTRVGGLKPLKIDVRFVAATNKDLEAEIVRGTFRRDLYYRLNGATLVIPPLRERPNEIVALAELFSTQAAKQLGLARPPTLSRAAVDALLQYAWPGNIRELRNVMERAVLLCAGAEILVSHLPVEKLRTTFAPVPVSAPAALPEAAPVVAYSALDAATDLVRPKPPAASEDSEMEKARILDALQQCMGNQTRAAELLGISRRTLVYKLTAYGIARPRKRD